MRKAFVLFLFVLTITFSYSQKVENTSVFIKTATGKVSGTLTLPQSKDKIPLTIIIPDAGYTDRDGNTTTLKCNSYKFLADSLLKNNIASLRYDKRGVGESEASAVTERDLRFDYYIDDAVAWINQMKQDKRFSKVIVIGHGEGSLIGMIAARKANADAFISINGGALSGDEQMKEQLSSMTDTGKKICFAVIDSLQAGKTVRITDITLNSMFRESIQQYLISWFKYHPQEEIAKLTIPVFILQGHMDVHVPPDNGVLLYRAKDKSKYFFIRKMNHYLKDGDKDNPQTLISRRNPNLPLVEDLVPSIMDFIEGN